MDKTFIPPTQAKHLGFIILASFPFSRAQPLSIRAVPPCDMAQCFTKSHPWAVLPTNKPTSFYQPLCGSLPEQN